MRRFCQKIIYQNEGRSNTYCMRAEGHKGECATEELQPQPEAESSTLSTEEFIRTKYGPYKDARSHRGF
jgi:hypothetical protein